MGTYFSASFNGFNWTTRPGLTAHVMAISHFVQRNTMDKLMSTGRFSKLSLNFAGYIALLVQEDLSPGELARRLGVSKQACSKAVRELEERGIVERRRNARDSRSSILSLGEAGQHLVVEGIQATAEIQRQFVAAVGSDRLEELIRILEKVHCKLAADFPQVWARDPVSGEAVNPTQLNLLLHLVSELFYQWLMRLLNEKGFEGLKSNFSQVLSLVIPDGGRIQYIASVVGVSKQAIAATASEMEELGYIARDPDPDDRRQIILRLAPRGEQLLAESETAIQKLESTIGDMLSAEEYRHLEETMAALYSQVIDHYDTSALPDRIQELSRKLLDDLGAAGARTLAQRLMTITRGKA